AAPIESSPVLSSESEFLLAAPPRAGAGYSDGLRVAFTRVVVDCALPPKSVRMSLRRTQGIVTDNSVSDPKREADVIMTAATLGLAADYIATTKTPIQFDMDPLDAGSASDRSKAALFTGAVNKIDAAVA